MNAPAGWPVCGTFSELISALTFFVEKQRTVYAAPERTPPVHFQQEPGDAWRGGKPCSFRSADRSGDREAKSETTTNRQQNLACTYVAPKIKKYTYTVGQPWSPKSNTVHESSMNSHTRLIANLVTYERYIVSGSGGGGGGGADRLIHWLKAIVATWHGVVCSNHHLHQHLLRLEPSGAPRYFPDLQLSVMLEDHAVPLGFPSGNVYLILLNRLFFLAVAAVVLDIAVVVRRKSMNVAHSRMLVSRKEKFTLSSSVPY
uniref:Uncharacterized protein n=1 Tax=Anopheles farauti TaxID=69004 RepID=A0A182QLS5_9DIPT